MQIPRVPLILTIFIVLFAPWSCRERATYSELVSLETQRQECSFEDESLTTSYYKIKNSKQWNAKLFKDKESFLNTLDKQLRSNFLLLYRSGSPDVASYEQPRVLLFDNRDHPRFILAHDGTPDRKHFEIIEFSNKYRRFCFHEISINDDGNLKFIDHPTSCVGCHRRDSRPNWESYNTWPSVYGSRDGAMRMDSVEAQGFKKFTEQSRFSGVYKTLEGPRELASDDGGGYLRFVNEVNGTKTSPHSQLTSGLVRLNNLRIARILKDLVQLENYSRYKHALLGALIGCPNIDTFLSEALRQNHPEPYLSILRSTKELIEIGNRSIDQKVIGINAQESEILPKGQLDLSVDQYMRAIADLRYLLENRKSGSISIADWSMSQASGYNFAAENVGITDTAPIFEQDVFGTQTKSLNEKSCDQLKTASLKD